MPYNPALPLDGSLIDAGEMRSQLNGLDDKIEAIPAGPPGPQGPQGDAGPAGSQGAPFAQAVVDGVNTLSPGTPATVGVSFDGTNVHFTFGIPEGEPGEVTDAALAAAIATTALNPNGIAPYSGSFSDPPTQAEMQAFAAYVETLRTALVRP